LKQDGAAVGTLESLTAGETFDDQVFEGLDLSDFDFSGKDFTRCTFRNLKLQQTRWPRARLEDCIFEGCDLTQMQPLDVGAHGVRFKGCKLMGVEWTKASLNPRLEFEECSLRYASFVDTHLRRTPFLRCNLVEASFIGTDLSEADFSSSDLTGATFQGSSLLKADLRQTKGLFLDPTKNRVKGARISMEAAALLATSFGMRVAGFDE
jgi:uncharacterized protein YjbI with pentapeptide repeats